MRRFRAQLHRFFKTPSPVRFLWDLTIYVLIFVSVLTLLFEYHVLPQFLDLAHYLVLDLVLASIFLLDYLLRFFASYQRQKFFFRTSNIVDLVAIVPSFFGFAFAHHIHSLRGVKILRFARLLRFLRLARLVRGISGARL